MIQMKELYRVLATLVQARENCLKVRNTEWFDRHTERIERLVKNYMPSGGGFDSGTTLNLSASYPNKLVFDTSFHHMDEAGYYSGWTEHTVTVTPDLASGYHLKVSGRNRNDIKDYIAECFSHSLKLTSGAGIDSNLAA